MYSPGMRRMAGLVTLLIPPTCGAAATLALASGHIFPGACLVFSTLLTFGLRVFWLWIFELSFRGDE